MADYEYAKVLKAHGAEVAIGALLLGGLGTVAALVTRKHLHRLEEREQNPGSADILNSLRLTDERRKNVNGVAAYILCGTLPDRQDIMRDLDLTRDHAQEAIGYLKDNNLARRVPGNHLQRAHYMPLQSLVIAGLETAMDRRHYPELASSLEMLVAEYPAIAAGLPPIPEGARPLPPASDNS